MDVPPSAIEHEWHAAIRIGVGVVAPQGPRLSATEKNGHTGVNTSSLGVNIFNTAHASPRCEHQDFEYEQITKSNRTQKAGGEPRLPFPLVLGNSLSRGRG